jgi:hypothetical protein
VKTRAPVCWRYDFPAGQPGNIGNILGDHNHRSEYGCSHQIHKARRIAKLHISYRRFTRRTERPLRTQRTGKRQRTQPSNPIFPAVTPHHSAVARIVLLFDIAEYRAFEGMRDIAGHKRIAIVPATHFPD